MVLQPGASTKLAMTFMMHGDMGGYHDFEVHLASNDVTWGDKTLAVLSNWVP